MASFFCASKTPIEHGWYPTPLTVSLRISIGWELTLTRGHPQRNWSLRGTRGLPALHYPDLFHWSSRCGSHDIGKWPNDWSPRGMHIGVIVIPNGLKLSVLHRQRKGCPSDTVEDAGPARCQRLCRM